MKLIGMFITAALLLAMLQAALSVLIVIGVIVFVIGFFCRPAETIGLLLFGAFASLLQSHPVGGIWLMSLALIMTAVVKRRESGVAISPSGPTLLSPEPPARGALNGPS